MLFRLNPFAEELIEVLLESHGDSGSFLTDVSPATIANSLRSNELVGATGFEPATPCAQGKPRRALEVVILE